MRLSARSAVPTEPGIAGDAVVAEPARPWLPWLALGMMLGCMAPGAAALAVGAGSAMSWWWCCGVPLALAAAWFEAPIPRWERARLPLASRVLALAAAALLGGALAERAGAGPGADPAASAPRLMELEGTVTTLGRLGYHQWATLSPSRMLLPTDAPLPRRLSVDVEDALPGLVVGDLVRVRGEWQRGSRGESIDAVGVERLVIRENGPRGWAWRALDRVQGHRALAESLLIGQGSPPELMDFRRSGLMHVLAVSGMHLVIAVMLASWLMRLVGLGWWPRQLALVALVAGYTWLTAASPATMRALAMELSVIAMGVMAREPHRFAAMSLSVIVLLVMDPLYATDIGFQLSIVAVAGIITLGMDLARLRERALPLAAWPLDRPAWRGLLWCGRSACDGFAIGISATLATAPIIAWHFCTAYPWSALATLFASPPATGALWLGLPCLGLDGLFPNGPWEGLYAGLEASLHALAVVVSWAATWPGAMLSVGVPSLAMVMLWPLLFISLRDARDLALRVAAVCALLLLW